MSIVWDSANKTAAPKERSPKVNAVWQERPKAWDGMKAGEVSEEVLRTIESDPSKAREVFTKLKAREAKSFVTRVNEVSGPVGRGAVRGAEGIGRFAVNSVMRGLSYIPGLEDWSDRADHMNRLAAIQKAYDQHQDETGLTSEFMGANGAKFTGALGETVSQTLLLGGLGRGANLATKPRAMTKFLAASYGAMDAERSLTVGKQAGLKGWRNNAYAAGNGALSAALTYGFGLLGERFGGGMSAEELVSRGAGRSLASLVSRNGMKKELLEMALEGGEEESIALSQGLLGTLFGMDTFEQYKANVGQAFVGGAVARGTFGAFRRLQNKFESVVEQLPKTVEGFSDAQKLAETGVLDKARKVERLSRTLEAAETAGGKANKRVKITKIPREIYEKVFDPAYKAVIQEQMDEEIGGIEIPEEIQSKMSDPVYKAAFDNEINEQAEIHKEVNKKLAPIEEARLSLETRKRALDAKTQAASSAGVDEETAKSIQVELESERAAIDEEAAIVDEQEKVLRQEAGNELRAEQEADDLMKGRDDAHSARELAELTSAKQAILDTDAAYFGFNRAPAAERQKWVETLEEVRNEGLHQRAMEIAQSSLSTNEVWNRKTKFAVAEGLRIKKQQYFENDAAVRQASPDADIDSLLAVDKRLRDDIAFLNEAIYRQQSEAGDAFNASKLITRLGGEVEKATRRARRSKGESLTEGENKAILESGSRVEQLEREIDAGRITEDERKELSDSADSIRQSLLDEKAETKPPREPLSDLEKISRVVTRLQDFDPADPIAKVAKDELDTLLSKASKVFKSEEATDADRAMLLKSLENLQTLSEKMGGLKPGTPEYEKASRELWEARRELENAEFVPQNRTFGARMARYNKMWHELVLAGDLSAMGIQGGIMSVTHPVKFIETMGRAFKNGMSSEGELNLLYDLHRSPNGDLYRQGVITLMDPDAPLMLGEDAGYKGVADVVSMKFPKAGKLLATLPRLYRTMLNSMRAGLFDMHVQSLGGRANMTKEELFAAGSFVDSVTGRGGRGYLDKAVTGLSLMALAPRNYASKLELLSGWHYWKSGQSPKIKRLIAKEYGRMFGSWFGVYAASLVGNFFAGLAGKEDISETQLNPFERRFLQIKVGNTWLDPSIKLGSYVSAVAKAGRALTYGLAGKKLRKRDGSLYDAGNVGTFLRGKASFPVGTAYDLVSGKDIMGNPVTVPNLIVNRATPISPREVIKAAVEDGVSERLIGSFFEVTGGQADYDVKKPNR